MKKKANDDLSGFDDEAFGQRLRQLRIALGLSEAEAAAAAQRSVATWCRYEATGIGRMTRPLLSFMAAHRHRLVEGEISWLFTGVGAPPRWRLRLVA